MRSWHDLTPEERNMAELKRRSSLSEPTEIFWGDHITPEKIWPCAQIPWLIGAISDENMRITTLNRLRSAFSRTKNKTSDAKKAIYAASREARLIAAEPSFAVRPDWGDVRWEHRAALMLDMAGRSHKLSEALQFSTTKGVRAADPWEDDLWRLGNDLDKDEYNNIRTACWPTARNIIHQNGPERLIRMAQETRKLLPQRVIQANISRASRAREKLPPRSTDGNVLLNFVPNHNFVFARHGFCASCDSDAPSTWLIVGSDGGFSASGRIVGSDIRHLADFGGPLLPSEVDYLIDALNQRLAR